VTVTISREIDEGKSIPQRVTVFAMPKTSRRNRSGAGSKRRKNFRRRGSYRSKRKFKRKAIRDYGAFPQQFKLLNYGRVDYSNRFKFVSHYMGGITLTPTSGIYPTYGFRGNSLWDPDASGAGNTVDNWARVNALCTRYYVYASKCTAQVLMISSTLESNTVVAWLKPSYTIESSYPNSQSLFQDVRCTKRVVPQGGARTSTTMTCTRRAKSMFPDSTITVTSAAMSSNPTEQWYYTIGGHDAIGADATSQVRMIFRITYYCIGFRAYQEGQ